MQVHFPDGSTRTPTDIRATYRCEYAGTNRDGAQTWASDAFFIRTSKSQRGPILVVETPEHRQIVACLDHQGDGNGYAGGCWVDGIPTGFTARRDGAALVLEVWDVAPCAPGPNAIPGLDAPL